MFLSNYDKCSLSEDFSVNLHPKCVSVVMVWKELKKEKKKIIIDGFKYDEKWQNVTKWQKILRQENIKYSLRL